MTPKEMTKFSVLAGAGPSPQPQPGSPFFVGFAQKSRKILKGCDVGIWDAEVAEAVPAIKG